MRWSRHWARPGTRRRACSISDDTHYFNSARARREGYAAIEAFLAQNLGPGMPPI